MRVGSLFAGIGGFDLAASRVWGWDCIEWQVEIDPFCQRVLAKHWPNVRRYGDIREVKAEELGAVDLICGGFPCQPFSIAGKRRGEDDDRHLWPEMLRVIRAVRPRWVVGENVANLARMALNGVWDDLESEGYETRAVSIPACAIGAIHIRERIWLLAHTNGKRREERDLSRVAGDTGQHSRLSPEGVYADTHGVRRNGRVEQRDGKAEDGDGAAGLRCSDWDRAEMGAAITRGIRGEEWGWTKPGLVRMADGIPGRMDRLKAVGNSIHPGIAEIIFRQIAAAEGA